MNTEEFVTASGDVLELRGVSPLLMQAIDEAFRKANPEPVIPTYMVTTLGGDKEIHEHDETTLTTDEEKEAWATYQLEDTEWKLLLNRKLLQTLILKGIATNLTPPDDWYEEQKFLGLELPDNPYEQKVTFFEREILRSPEDLVAIISKIMRLSGLSQEVLDEADDLFRGELQGETDSLEHATE